MYYINEKQRCQQAENILDGYKWNVFVKKKEYKFYKKGITRRPDNKGWPHAFIYLIHIHVIIGGIPIEIHNRIVKKKG